jgi:uncharacterized protein (TIGR02145 family)
MKKILTGFLIIWAMTGARAQQMGTIKDASGNVYNTVKIGEKTWMTENLRTTKFKNGESIAEVTDNEVWKHTSYPETPAWCWYDNNSEYDKKYGKLYNLIAVSDSRCLCPEGWHVANSNDWNDLIKVYKPDELKPYSTFAPQLFSKEFGGTNEYGLNLQVTGRRSSVGEFVAINDIAGYYWLSTRVMGYVQAAKDTMDAVVYKPFGWLNHSSTYGLPVRCVKNL